MNIKGLMSRLASASERVRTVPGLARDVTTLVVAVAVTVGLSGFILSQMNFAPPWGNQFKFSVELANAPAVNPNTTNAVTIAGVEVGKLADWTVAPNGNARLSLEIKPGHAIYSNAHAVLRPVSPLNEMYIEVDPGGPPAKPLPRNGVIPATQTRHPIQVDDVLKHLDARQQEALRGMLESADVALARAPSELPGGLRATDDTLVTLQPVVQALEMRRNNIKRLVTALAGISQAVGANHGRLVSLLDSTQQTLGVLARNDGALRNSLKQLPGLNGQLTNAFRGTQGLTKELDPTLTNLTRASDKLPTSLNRLTALAPKIGHTVDAARPFVEKARPVTADLRPFVRDLDVALDDTLPITTNLDRDTRILVPYLNDIQAFIYNTRSVYSVKDGRGNIIRGHAVVRLPDGGLLPGGAGGHGRDPRPVPEPRGGK